MQIFIRNARLEEEWTFDKRLGFEDESDEGRDERGSQTLRATSDEKQCQTKSNGAMICAGRRVATRE